MKLYDYFRSSASFRVRIALNLKGIDYERIPVSLVDGEQALDAYRAVNPQGLVPALETDDGVLIQSLAIIEYLEETHPEPPLLPTEALGRARERALAQVVACDIHPLNNLRVRAYLRQRLGQEEATVREWMVHWMLAGFEALEAHATAAPFLGGDAPMLSDVCLAPQMFNARRFEMPLDDFPRLVAIDERLRTLEAFARAAPQET